MLLMNKIVSPFSNVVWSMRMTAIVKAPEGKGTTFVGDPFLSPENLSPEKVNFDKLAA